MTPARSAGQHRSSMCSQGRQEAVQSTAVTRIESSTNMSRAGPPALASALPLRAHRDREQLLSHAAQGQQRSAAGCWKGHGHQALCKQQTVPDRSRWAGGGGVQGTSVCRPGKGSSLRGVQTQRRPLSLPCTVASQRLGQREPWPAVMPAGCQLAGVRQDAEYCCQ